MPNIFRQALQLLEIKPLLEMTEGEQEIVAAATIPLLRLPEFNNKTTDEGLEELARLMEGKEQHLG